MDLFEKIDQFIQTLEKSERESYGLYDPVWFFTESMTICDLVPLELKKGTAEYRRKIAHKLEELQTHLQKNTETMSRITGKTEEQVLARIASREGVNAEEGKFLDVLQSAIQRRVHAVEEVMQGFSIQTLDEIKPAAKTRAAKRRNRTVKKA